MRLSNCFVRVPCGERLMLAGLAILCLTATRSLGGQSPVPPTPVPLPSYRPPVLALVQPPSGGSVPQDRPVIVFRFAPGDSADPIDTRSFAIAVDGKDRSGLFQAAHDMAWGSIGSAEEGGALSVAVHSIAARICSVRGACTDISVSVTVSTPAVSRPITTADRKRTVLDLLLAAVKKLLAP